MGRAVSGPEFHVNSGSGQVGSLHLWVGLGRVGSGQENRTHVLLFPGQTPFFTAVRGSVRVRTLPRGSDRVRSTGHCPLGSVLRVTTGGDLLPFSTPDHIGPHWTYFTRPQCVMVEVRARSDMVIRQTY